MILGHEKKAELILKLTESIGRMCANQGAPTPEHTAKWITDTLGKIEHNLKGQ